MELFRDTKFDFLGKKWPFIIGSLVLTAAGLTSLALRGGPAYGIDFKGGALMYVRLADRPTVQMIEKIRSALSARISGEISVVEVQGSASEVMVGTELKEERALDAARGTMIETLNAALAQPGAKLDFNNAGQTALVEQLRDPFQRAGISLSDQQLADRVKAMLDYRNTSPRSGLIRSFDELASVPGVNSAMIGVLKQELSLAPFAVRSVEVVGPKVGRELRQQAVYTVLAALGGMLVYIAFRFEWIYGVAAVIAVFHDTIITIGLFSIFNKEISLTVVAALLTLVGYSMNDTIVVFDRIRENLRILRREKLEALINTSVNQTLSRTILTSGLTLLTALSLFLFGGPVLHGFSFALVVGIIIGTYSSIFIASPILVFWQDFVERRKRGRFQPPPPPAPVAKETARKGSAKSVR